MFGCGIWIVWRRGVGTLLGRGGRYFVGEEGRYYVGQGGMYFVRVWDMDCMEEETALGQGNVGW